MLHTQASACHSILTNHRYYHYDTEGPESP